MDINNFGPFESDVWGTVSDWAAVIAYGLTGYYIFRTFKSQLKVQTLQQEHTNIEIFNHKKKILPKFNLSIFPYKFKTIDGYIEFENVQFEFSLNENIARDVKIEVDRSKSPGWYNLNYSEGEFVNAGKSIKITLDFKNEAKPSSTMIPIYYIDIDFILKYTDIDFNPYKQICHCTLQNGNVYVSSDNPLPLNVAKVK